MYTAKEKMIVAVIGWNLDQNRFDHDTGEEEMIEWIIETHKRLEGMTEQELCMLQYANSLAAIEDMLIDALCTDGAQHKQYYLYQLAKKFGIDVGSITPDQGIAP